MFKRNLLTRKKAGCILLFIVIQLLVGCNQENNPEVNVYSSRNEALIKPALDRFTESSGVQVNLVTGKADALIERLKAEGSASPADVLITVDAGRLHRAKTLGLTQSVTSDALNTAVPATYRDPEGHWYGLSLRARPIMYAKDRVNPTDLSDYESLTDEKWLGKVCIRSSGNIYNQSLLASMVASVGSNVAGKWAAGLVKNFARKPVGGDRDQIKAVATGQCDVAIANTYYLFGMLQSGDPDQVAAAGKVAVFWPNQKGRGTHVNVSGMAVTQAAKNINAAQQLLEFLVQEESQSWYANTNGEYPVKTATPVHPLLSTWGEFKKDAINLSQLGELNTEAVKIMDRAGWP